MAFLCCLSTITTNSWNFYSVHPCTIRLAWCDTFILISRSLLLCKLSLLFHLLYFWLTFIFLFLFYNFIFYFDCYFLEFGLRHSFSSLYFSQICFSYILLLFKFLRCFPSLLLSNYLYWNCFLFIMLCDHFTLPLFHTRCNFFLHRYRDLSLDIRLPLSLCFLSFKLLIFFASNWKLRFRCSLYDNDVFNSVKNYSICNIVTTLKNSKWKFNPGELLLLFLSDDVAFE